MTTKVNFGELSNLQMAVVGDLSYSLVEFAKKTNPYLYFYITEIGIGSDNNDNIQVKYQVTDIEGDERTLTVTVESGKIICEPAKFFDFGRDENNKPVRGLIAGVERSGKPINAIGKGIDANFMSELMLLLTDVERISNKVGISIGRVIFPGDSKMLSFVDMYQVPGGDVGDVTIKFQDTNENMNALGKMVDEMRAAAGETTKVGAQLVPAGTPINTLGDGFWVVDMASGDVVHKGIVAIESPQYNDLSDYNEMIELAENDGIHLQVLGGKGRKIESIDLVVDPEEGRTYGSDLRLVKDMPSGLSESDVIGFAMQQGVELVAGR